MKKNRLFCIAAALMLIAAGIVTLVRHTIGTIGESAPRQTVQHQTATAWWQMRLPDTAGNMHSLAQYRGKPLVLHFWASWCAPCIDEIPALSAAYHEYARNGIQFVSIAIDSASNIAQFTHKPPITYPVYIAGFAGVEWSRALGNVQGGLPFTVVLDASGRIRHTTIGKLKLSELRRRLDRL